MLKITFAILLLALLACGSGDSDRSTSTTAGSLPPVSAAGPNQLDTITTPRTVVDDLLAGRFEIESCLALVAGGQFANAIPACNEAAALAPENTQVRTALNEAQTQSAAGAVTAAAQSTSEIRLLDTPDAPLRTQRTKPPRP
jgi:hypothetical protein